MLALYMAMHRLSEIAGELSAAGLPPGQPVEIAASVGTRAERHLDTTLARLAADAATAGIANPAVVLLCLPKSAAAIRQRTARAAVPASPPEERAAGPATRGKACAAGAPPGSPGRVGAGRVSAGGSHPAR
jgi:hypothetical protein